MDSASSSTSKPKSEEKSTKKSSVSSTTPTIGTFGSIVNNSNESGKIGSLKGTKFNFKPKVNQRRKIKTEEEKEKKSKKQGKKNFRERNRKPRGRPVYEPSALSGPFAQGAARPSFKKEYGAGQSTSGIKSGGIKIEEDDDERIQPKSRNIKFKNMENDSDEDEDYEEDDKSLSQPISIVDLTTEINERLEKIRLEEKSFTFNKIKFEEDGEESTEDQAEIKTENENKDDIKKIIKSEEVENEGETKNEDNMDVDTTPKPAEDSEDTIKYNYPASELLRNDIKPENNILFFQFPLALPEVNKEDQLNEFNKSKKNQNGKLKKEMKYNQPQPIHSAIKMENGSSKANMMEAAILNNEREAPEGKMGKIIIRQSGKMQIKIGNILFDVNAGTDCNFYQNAFSYNKEKKEGYILGDIRKKYVCTPNLDSLLSN